MRPQLPITQQIFKLTFSKRVHECFEDKMELRFIIARTVYWDAEEVTTIALYVGKWNVFTNVLPYAMKIIWDKLHSNLNLV